MKKMACLVMGVILILSNITTVSARTTYVYDNLNRVIEVRYEDGSYTKYKYDDAGNITSVQTVKANPTPKPIVTELPKQPDTSSKTSDINGLPTLLTDTLKKLTSMPTIPKAVKIKKKKKKIQISWKKVKSAKGYQIYASKKKKGKYKHIKTVKTNKAITKPGKYKYFKIRSYKINNRKKIYSSFSKTKKT